MKFLIPFVFCLLPIFTFGQSKPILVYDLQTGGIDSLAIPNIDTNIRKGQTQYSLGNYNSNYANLDSIIPSTNVFPNTQFALKRPVDDQYNSEDFPIRSAVALFRWKNDTLAQLCSGSMISARHVLIAAHCVSSGMISPRELYDFDSLMVASIPNNGQFNLNFNTSIVRKIYMLKNWRLGSEDMTVLELEREIGRETGYLGIGYNDDDQELSNELFYKFSYPALKNFANDTNDYNGDTLYYGFGSIDFLTPDLLGINTAYGIPGESGSSLIRVKNERDYTSYGILSFALNYSHCRLNNFRYHSLKAIIEQDLLSDPEPSTSVNFSIYPNPFVYGIYLEFPPNTSIEKILIYNSAGQVLREIQVLKNSDFVDLEDLKSGIYTIEIQTKGMKYHKKLIKR